MTSDYRVLCVPPLMARDPFSSHALYLGNIQAALARRAPGLQVEALPLPPETQESRLRRKVVQLTVLPRLVRRRLAELRNTPVVLHLLDHHYAYLRQPGVPCVLTCNGVFDRRPWMPRLPRYLYRTSSLPRADRIVAVSRAAQADIEDIFHVASKKTSVCYYGVEPVFQPGLPPAHIPNRGRSVLLLHVGSNLPQKNVATVLRALRIGLDWGLDVKLVKVGDTLDASGHARAVDGLQLGDRIIQLGKLAPTELARVYNTCDIFVFPSVYEGFGRPIVEAQACGIVCVLAAASCLPEVAGDGAMYHAAYDAYGLASRISALVRDSTLRAGLVARGFANARRFSWDHHADGLLEAYGLALSSVGWREPSTNDGRLCAQGSR